MSKKATLLLATMFLVVVAIAAPVVLATTQAENGPPPQTQTSADTVATPAADQAAPNDIERAVPPAGTPGFYISNGIYSVPLSPDTYSGAGSYRIWAWVELQYGPGHYDWARLDDYMQRQLDAGYGSLAIALNVFGSRYYACPRQGIEDIPAFVSKGADGVFGTADDPVITAGEPDYRDCNGNGLDDEPWYLIDYTHPFFVDNYKAFINALAEHIRTSSYHDKVAWIGTGVGQYGENKAADNRVTDPPRLARDQDFLRDNGFLSDNQWLDYAKGIIDEYRSAFAPDYTVITQNAPFYNHPANRRFLAQYASEHGVGISVNQILSDTMSDRKCDNPSQYCLGMWDQSWQYRNLVPISFETYSYMLPTDNEFYLGMARALNYKADYVRLESFWHYEQSDTPANHITAQWAAKYFGKGFNLGDESREPSSVWSRMREHRNPCFVGQGYVNYNCNDWPTTGNYEFYLTQLHLPELGGVTFPVTDDDRIAHTGWVTSGGGVTDKPWYWNDSPYEQPLRDVGLFRLTGAEGMQREVDPGMIARRSDQASGNSKFIFDADDNYFKRSQPPAESTFKIIITVTYLDHGDDEWLLVYDAVGGPKAAEVYAINDWDIASGLAVEGGLPSTGKLTTSIDYVKKTNSGQWKVATFRIDDGDFNNLLLGGKADFYIETKSRNGEWDGDEYIHHVDVQKVDEFIVVTPTPTASPTITPTPTSTPTSTPTVTPIPSMLYLPMLQVSSD
jgi:hypothetical protein